MGQPVDFKSGGKLSETPLPQTFGNLIFLREKF